MSATSSRIQVIDTIRGIALGGILLFNIQTYALFAFLDPDQVYGLAMDQRATYAPLQFLLHVLVNGQFYTLYSFLFGLGFYMLWKKNEESGTDGDLLFRRRLWILLLIGLVHGLLFWFGDILHKYALFGFALPYFNRKSVTALLKWIIALLLCSMVLQAVFIFVLPSTVGNSAQIDPILLEVIDTWQHGTFTEVMGMQKLGLAMLWVRGIMGGMASMALYLIMFLLGLIAGKVNIFTRVPEFRGSMLRIGLFLLPVALVLKSCSHLSILGMKPVGGTVGSSLSNFIAVPLLTVSYLIFMTLFLSRTSLPVFKWIGNAGRMGLTNYLMQTLICMPLFYGYAGGLAGKLTLLEVSLVAVLIFSFQITLSNIWLRYYSSGPMEVLWRKLSSS